MDVNLYGLEYHAAAKLDEARAEGARARLLASLGLHRHGVLDVAGLALIKLGRFVQRRGSSRRRAGRTPLANWS